jgi:hypothetical protein
VSGQTNCYGSVSEGCRGYISLITAYAIFSPNMGKTSIAFAKSRVFSGDLNVNRFISSRIFAISMDSWSKQHLEEMIFRCTVGDLRTTVSHLKKQATDIRKQGARPSQNPSNEKSSGH